MTGVALILGLLPALVIGLLAVPLSVAFSIRRLRETRGVIRFRWLFGIVRFRVRIPRAGATAARPAPEGEVRAPGRKQRKSRQRWRPGGVLSLMRERAIRRRVVGFLRDLLRATHARRLFLRLRIGLGDPADTGRLWALVGPVAGLARNVSGATLRIEPEFIDPVFEVESHGQFRLVPLRLIALTAAFALSPTMLRAWWRLSRGHS